MTFTTREMQVVQGVADGLLDKEIADRICISRKTVKFYLCRVYEKLGFNGAGSRYKLMRYCFKEGIAR